jgi:hypothetical protein
VQTAARLSIRWKGPEIVDGISGQLGESIYEQDTVVPEGSRMYLEAGEPNEGEPRSPSAVIGFRVLDVQPVKELLGCPFGPERVKDHVLPVLRDDLVFALGL